LALDDILRERQKAAAVSSFYRPLPEAKKHAKVAVLHLKERMQKHQNDHR
jgi:hypothetical protein